MHVKVAFFPVDVGICWQRWPVDQLECTRVGLKSVVRWRCNTLYGSLRHKSLAIRAKLELLGRNRRGELEMFVDSRQVDEPRTASGQVEGAKQHERNTDQQVKALALGLHESVQRDGIWNVVGDGRGNGTALATIAAKMRHSMRIDFM